MIVEQKEMKGQNSTKMPRFFRQSKQQSDHQVAIAYLGNVLNQLKEHGVSTTATSDNFTNEDYCEIKSLAANRPDLDDLVDKLKSFTVYSSMAVGANTQCQDQAISTASMPRKLLHLQQALENKENLSLKRVLEALQDDLRPEEVIEFQNNHFRTFTLMSLKQLVMLKFTKKEATSLINDLTILSGIDVASLPCPLTTAMPQTRDVLMYNPVPIQATLKSLTTTSIAYPQALSFLAMALFASVIGCVVYTSAKLIKMNSRTSPRTTGDLMPQQNDE